jgi:diadenosine tetraphosphate (Ap4A) HIT family hydrolase
VSAMNEPYQPDDSCVFCGDNPRTVWESSALRLCSDPAPLAAGHALLFPKVHFPSAADVTTAVAEEMDDVGDQISAIFRGRFGAFTMFEHGRTGHCLRSNEGERMCHHAHVHFLPVDLDLSALAAIGQSRDWAGWADVADFGADTDGYAIMDGTAQDRLFHPVNHDLEPHYLRTCVAQALGVPERADWENFSSIPGSAEFAEASHDVVTTVAETLRDGSARKNSASGVTHVG